MSIIRVPVVTETDIATIIEVTRYPEDSELSLVNHIAFIMSLVNEVTNAKGIPDVIDAAYQLKAHMRNRQ